MKNKYEIFILFASFCAIVCFVLSIPFFAEYKSFHSILSYHESTCKMTDPQIIQIKRCKCGDWMCIDANLPIWNFNNTTVGYDMYPEKLILTSAYQILNNVPLNQNIPCLVAPSDNPDIVYPQYTYQSKICKISLNVYLNVQFKQYIQKQLNIGLLLLVPIAIEILIFIIIIIFSVIKKKKTYQPLQPT